MIPRAAILAASFTRVVAGDFTYVDATVQNTTLNGAAITLGTDVLNNASGSATDGKWSLRSLTGFEQGNYFESDMGTATGDAETTPDLITTITIPTPGTYDVVVVFAKVANRDIAAKIGSSPGAADIFKASNSLNTDQSPTYPDIRFDGTYSNGRGANHGAGELGQVTTTVPNQTVSIFINGLSSVSGSVDQRTQYDGIGYGVHVPRVPVHRDVFILAGQSNADGRGDTVDLTGDLAVYAGTHPEVIIHYTSPAYTSTDRSRYQKWVRLAPGFSSFNGSTALPQSRFGPEIGIGHMLAGHYDHPAIIKVTRGGTSLTVPGTNWYPADADSPDVGELYTALITTTKAALQELTDAGDTYTVHALFWHQGESDSGAGRIDRYAGVYEDFVKRVRADLGLPNLRFITGQLAANRPPDFENIQWQITRSLRNVSFVSSENLTTWDAQTHFDARSSVTFGLRYGSAAVRDYADINFDFPAFTTGPVNRQNDFSSTLPDQPLIEPTLSQGEYIGGQAVGHTGFAGDVFLFNRRGILPLSGAETMKADFFAGDAGYDNDSTPNSSLHVHAWKSDGNKDGNFTESEAALGFGLENDGKFSIRAGGSAFTSESHSYETDRWYRLTLEWSSPDGDGSRTATLSVRDLLTGTDLNVGLPVVTATVGAEMFGDLSTWFGMGFAVNRGLIDNISAEPPGFTGWLRRFPGHPVSGDDDTDGDGFNSHAEFALGLDPTKFDRRAGLSQPLIGTDEISLSITPVARLADVVYQIEWSPDLVEWHVEDGTESGARLDFTLPKGTRGFFRERFTVGP